MNEAAEQRVSIVGVGADGLDGLPTVPRERITSAEVLVGTDDSLSLIDPQRTAAERLQLAGDFETAVQRVREGLGRQRMVVVTGGDPLFYSVARYLIERVGREHFEIHPHVSSMQLAFARVAHSWDDAYLANVAHKPLDSIVDRVRTAGTVGLFTDQSRTPAVVARALLAAGIDYFEAAVCENLGTRNENVVRGPLARVAGMDFGPLNVMVLIRDPDAPDTPRQHRRRPFGNPDDAFLQSRPGTGLVTPAELRTLALARLELQRDSVVWDVGAGSGSVGVEAAALAPDGQVHAVEPDPEEAALIPRNAERFGVGNVHVVVGAAPQVLADLPDPDAVFVGGTGRETANIARVVAGRLKPGGRVVFNSRSVDNTTATTAVLHEALGHVDVLLANFSHAVHQLESLRLEPIAPSFLISAAKEH